MLMARPRAQDSVMIHIATREDLPPSYADELRKIVREQMDDPELTVRVPNWLTPVGFSARTEILPVFPLLFSQAT